MRLLLLACVLVTSAAYAVTAQADDVLFFVNMNYSSDELKAARDTAAKKEMATGRKTRVVVVPPEELIPEAEALFAARDSLKKKLKQQFPQLQKGQLNAIVGDFMTRGLNGRHKEYASALDSNEIERLHDRTMEFHERERSFGPLDQQIKSMGRKLEGEKVRDFIISSHSNGSTLTSETTLEITVSQLRTISDDVPRLFKDATHVLLMGCYNLTDTYIGPWQELFSSAGLMGGFGIQAPIRTDPASGNFIRQVLGKAYDLDRQLAGASSLLDPNLVDKAFKGLSAVSATDSVIAYCGQIIEGRPNSFHATCEQQWINLIRTAELMDLKYLNLKRMSAEPTDDNITTEIRPFYSQLKDVCRALKNRDFDQATAAQWEVYRTQTQAALIRLIHWGNVQINFSTYLEAEIKDTNETLSANGIDPIPPLDGTMGRVEFTRHFRRIKDQLELELEDVSRRRSRTTSATERSSLDKKERRLEAVKRQFNSTYKPLYYMVDSDAKVGEDVSVTADEALGLYAIPFHWIETGVVTGARTEE